MSRAVGIDLAESSARILSIDVTGKKTSILRFHEAAIPHDPATPWEARAAATLKKALSDSGVPRGRIVAALDSGDAILREVSLPFKGDEQIRKTVRFEMESQIHNYTIEQLVVAHYRTGETDKGSLLLAAAVPKAVVAKRLDLLREAGVDPVALDLDVCAIFSAMLHAGAIATDEPQLLVYGTSKFTKLVFVEQRRPRSIRTIRFSMVGAPRAAARRAPREEDLPGTEEAIAVLTDEEFQQFSELDLEEQSSLVEILSKEISRFLLAHAASAQPAHILLSGAFEDQAAADMLHAATQIPVRTFNLVEALGGDGAASLRDRSSAVGVALGLALKGAGVDPLGMDFRQEEFEYRKKFDALKNTLFVTAQLAIVFLLAVTLHYYLARRDAIRARETIVNHEGDLYANVTNETLADPHQAFTKMRDLSGNYQTQLGQDLPIRSAREAWRDLFTALERVQKRWGGQKLGEGEFLCILESLDIQQNTTPGSESLTTTLRGRIRNLEFAGKLKDEVRLMPFFKNADWVGNLDPDENGLYRFMLRATAPKGK